MLHCMGGLMVGFKYMSINTYPILFPSWISNQAVRCACVVCLCLSILMALWRSSSAVWLVPLKRAS